FFAVVVKKIESANWNKASFLLIVKAVGQTLRVCVQDVRILRFSRMKFSLSHKCPIAPYSIWASVVAIAEKPPIPLADFVESARYMAARPGDRWFVFSKQALSS